MDPPPLSEAIADAHQFLPFTTAPNRQAAVAYGRGKEDAYFEARRTDFARSRDHLAGGLADAGFAVLPAEGTYFLPTHLAPTGIPRYDVTFCERAVSEARVAAIPPSALYAEEPRTEERRVGKEWAQTCTTRTSTYN